MNIIAGSIVVGAAIISGSLIWATDRTAQDARCAGYLASPKGGEALFTFSVLELQRGGRLGDALKVGPDSTEFMRVWEKDGKASYEAMLYLQGLRLAGCRLSPVS
jgi:hypothetical protein